MLNIIKLIMFVVVISYAFIQNSNAGTKRDDLFLTKAEQAEIAEYLNGICGDTFCGGDFDFKNIGVFCDKNCSVYYDVSPHAKNDYFSPDAFYRAPEEYKSESTPKMFLKLYNAKNFNDFTYGVNGELLYFKNIKITARCILKNIQDIQLSTFNEKKDFIYNAQLECTDSIVDKLRTIQSFLFSY